MQTQPMNIYQTARKSAGITQEKASEHLCVSIESLRAYEGGRTTPPNDVVSHMVAIYNTQHLAYQHVMCSEVARQCLPPMEIKDLPAAVLNLQKQVKDFLDCRNELLDIAYDGIITDEERPRFDAIVKELDDIVAAVMSLKYAHGKGE